VRRWRIVLALALSLTAAAACGSVSVFQVQGIELSVAHTMTLSAIQDEDMTMQASDDEQWLRVDLKVENLDPGGVQQYFEVVSGWRGHVESVDDTGFTSTVHRVRAYTGMYTYKYAPDVTDMVCMEFYVSAQARSCVLTWPDGSSTTVPVNSE
jgi:hypothetical protein